MRRHTKLSLLLAIAVVYLATTATQSRLVAQEPAHAVDPGQHAVTKAGEAHGAAGSGESHAAAEKTPGPLDLKPTLSIFSLVVFVGLLLILSRFAWKPLLEALHKREQHLEHVLHETERARNESETLMAEHRKVMGKAGDEVRGILEKARSEAQIAADSIVKQAQTEADLARQRAQREIASARDQALAEIWQKTADMAVSVAGRVLTRELSTDDHRRLLDAAISELPSKATNGHGGSPV